MKCTLPAPSTFFPFSSRHCTAITTEWVSNQRERPHKRLKERNLERSQKSTHLSWINGLFECFCILVFRHFKVDIFTNIYIYSLKRLSFLKETYISDVSAVSMDGSTRSVGLLKKL